MSSEEFSILVWCWHDPQTDTTKLRVVNVDTGEEVHLNDGTFLLRISIERDASLLRCLIRHIGSGHEAYMQSGINLLDFVKEHLLNNDAPEPNKPGTGIERP
jgi:hypothetical protein